MKWSLILILGLSLSAVAGPTMLPVMPNNYSPTIPGWQNTLYGYASYPTVPHILPMPLPMPNLLQNYMSPNYAYGNYRPTNQMQMGGNFMTQFQSPIISSPFSVAPQMNMNMLAQMMSSFFSSMNTSTPHTDTVVSHDDVALKHHEDKDHDSNIDEILANVGVAHHYGNESEAPDCNCAPPVHVSTVRIARPAPRAAAVYDTGAATEASVTTPRSGHSDVVAGEAEPSRAPLAPARPAARPQGLRPGGGPIRDEVLPRAEISRIHAKNMDDRDPLQSDIIARSPFLNWFGQCAPGCQPINYMVFGDRKDARSCHTLGRAIDVFGMQCGSQKYMAVDEMYRPGRFTALVACMKQVMPFHAKGQYPVLWHQHEGRGITDDHWNHAHFSIGCHGGTYW